MASTALFSTHGLGRRVSERWLFRRLDLSLDPGERLGLVGPSGSGKSQLLRTLAGLEAADEGAIQRRGHPVASFDSEHRAFALYLHQEPVFREGTVAENLELVANLAWVRRNSVAPRGADWLRRLERPDLLDRDVGALSGGERRLVALARALQTSPNILLLDEPLTGLDRDAADRATRALQEWQRAEADHAWIWSGHHRDDLSPFADRVVDLASSTQTPSAQRDPS